MSQSIIDPTSVMSRRGVLALGGSAVGGLLAATSLGLGASVAEAAPDSHSGMPPSKATAHEIERIIGAQGTTSDGVFSIDIDRKDISDITLKGVSIKPAFQINGQLVFEEVKPGHVMMNADFPLKSGEMDRFIDRMLQHDIVFQAQHQHFYDFSPMVWFVHFRAYGEPLQVARRVKAALDVTSTPFPQTSPKNPKTPLPAHELGRILGAKPSIGEDGVVNFQVARAERISLGGIHINPYLNIETPIAFQPLGDGHEAAAVPDFGMIASEVNGVIGVMRRQGWDIGCLYNQETDEDPQLYFSHHFKTGNAVTLAHEIRNGLNRMHVKFKG